MRLLTSFRQMTNTICLVWFILCCCSVANAELPRALPEGQLPNDSRLKPPKDLNGYFPFQPPKNLDEWKVRAEQLRRRILISSGLWPMPPETPLQPVIHGKVQRDGFTVEKVYFESYPGLFVTGLLFRPDGKTGPFPAVLSPHGHGGRMMDLGEKKVRQFIVEGAERFEASGRFPKLARCAQLARMGCVTFIYDMLGYADSQQLSYDLAHRLAKQRPELDRPDRWGLYSTQAELRLQNVLGIQVYNSIRSLDFLCSLPDVDTSRVGITGGSGGGTQTILLGALDQRPIVSFPQGMVSTSMQGGCTCENATLLRIGTGNIELAGLFAPRPLGMTGANDWTKEIMTKGYPELQQLYELYGVKQRVMCKPLLHFPHNYNYVTRAIMYGWFNTYLKLGLEVPIVEEDFVPLTESEAAVWNEQHPVPPGGLEFELAFTRELAEISDKQLAEISPTDPDRWKRYQQIVGGAYDIIFGRPFPTAAEIKSQSVLLEDRGDYFLSVALIRNISHEEEIPVYSLMPKKTAWNKQVVIWTEGSGKASVLEEDGRPKREPKRLVDAGFLVLSADLLYQGEFLANGQPLAQTPTVANPREFAGYTLGYNDSLFVERVHDILNLVAFFRYDNHHPEKVYVVGINGTGPLAAAAAIAAGDKVDGVAIDTLGFRFRRLTSYRDPDFLAGAVKYGDLPGMLALLAPRPLWIAGEVGEVPEPIAEAYRTNQAEAAVVSSATPTSTADLVEWLLNR